VEAVALIGWWFVQAWGQDGWQANLTLFSTFNIGTTLIQWAVVLAILLLLNRFLVGKTLASAE
jgi:hypothetical protein